MAVVDLLSTRLYFLPRIGMYTRSERIVALHTPSMVKLFAFITEIQTKSFKKHLSYA